LRHSTPAPGSGDTPFNHSGRTLFHQPSQPNLVQQPTHSTGHSTSRCFNYERASLKNETTCRAANMEFLSVSNVCHFHQSSLCTRLLGACEVLSSPYIKIWF
jgi:hypothetical protein